MKEGLFGLHLAGVRIDKLLREAGHTPMSGDVWHVWHRLEAMEGPLEGFTSSMLDAASGATREAYQKQESR